MNFRYIKYAVALTLGFSLTASSAFADDGPSLEDTVRYISAYLTDQSDHLSLQGEYIIFDKYPKCSFDARLPIAELNPALEMQAAKGRSFTATITCKTGDCIRKFSDCDHRANGAIPSLDLTFEEVKRTAVKKAFDHLFETVGNAQNDPFVD